MKKTLLAKIFLFCFILISSQARSQGWTGLVGGSYNGVTNGYVNEVVVWNGYVYVAGSFTTVGGTVSASNIAKWNGTTQTWSALSSGITGTGAEVKALCVYNGALYVGGKFTNAGGVTATNIAKYDGTNWSAVGATQGTGSDVYSMYVYNSLLYVGGNFLTAGGVSAHYVGTWNSATSTWAGSGSGTSGFVYCFADFGGSLYAGVQGGFVLDKLVGSTWTQASTLNNAAYAINTLCPYNGNLYCSGTFTVGPVQNFAKFNGTSFSNVGGANIPLAPQGAVYASAMKVFQNKLWVGGSFTGVYQGASLVANTAKLAAWSTVSGMWTTAYVSPTPIANGDVYAIDTGLTGSPATNYIYVGGGFTTPYNRVIRGVTNVGIEEVTMPEGMISVYPNPAHGRIHISVNREVKNPSVEIYNILGEKVYSDALKTNFEPVITKEFTPGVYFVKVLSQETATNSVKVFTQKVVVE